MQGPEVPVRVAVRVRPLLPRERLHNHQVCVRVIPGANQLVLGKDRAFTFDHVLTSKTSQDEAYSKIVEPLVHSCFEGYNATVFAYGQTGSGKTYTIVGGGNTDTITEEEYGIIPRAIKQIFSTIAENHNVDYTVLVSYIEVYMEELRDLIELETSSKDLHIREDENGNTVIIGAKEEQCCSVEEVMAILASGSASRQTGTTLMNEHSSRSHSIFTLVIEQRWRDVDTATSLAPAEDDLDSTTKDTRFVSSKFHFVDLAGSERAQKTGNVGDRFKESIHINSGLLALGNVISALGDTKKKISHIPYRDSKITRLLKDSLGGNAQTAMITCISPSSSDFDETLNSLKYANRARNIKNKPIVNTDPQSIAMDAMRTEIEALKEELRRQRDAYRDLTETERDATPEDLRVRMLEEQLAQSKTECAHYRLCAEEAYKQFVDVQQSDILTKSQEARIQNWLDLMDEVKNEVPGAFILGGEEADQEAMNKLKKDLKKAHKDLKSDEEIFAEKAREASQMAERIQKLEAENQSLREKLALTEERLGEQEQKLIDQQVLIENLQQLESDQTNSVIEVSDTPDVLPRNGALPSARAHSAPVRTKLRNFSIASSSQIGLRPESRKVHTSPGVFSLERVIQNFRARSHLLANQLEDNDKVQHEQFSDASEEQNSDDEDDPAKALGGTWKVKRKAATELGEDTKVSFKLALAGDLPDDDGEPIRREITDKRESKGVSIWVDPQSKSLNVEVENLRASTHVTRQRMKESEVRLQTANQKMRELALNIRMKEELIRELVKTGKDAQVMNRQYSAKVQQLEKDAEQAKKEAMETQKKLQEVENRGHHESNEKEKLQKDFRKKMETAKSRVQALAKKQREKEKVATLHGQNDKRIHDLELSIRDMKQQHDNLHKKLKAEADGKTKLERELQKDQQRIKDLEIQNQQQQKILKRKTEEVAAAKKRLRQGSAGTLGFTADLEQQKLDEQRRWLDEEMEKVLERRRGVEMLEGELQKREEILAKKEAMITERSQLEMKKLRSSQIITKDLTTLSSRLEEVDRKLEERTGALSTGETDERQRVKEEVRTLRQGRDKISRQRDALDSKLAQGNVLDPQEERRLIELDEAIEALDAAIEYKNDLIASRRQELRRSELTHSEDMLLGKLHALSVSETRTLLTKYFDKVISLREGERRLELQYGEMELKVDEQNRVIREMEASLQRAAMDTERKLLNQQKEYEKQVQFLMQQASEGSKETTEETIGQLEQKCQLLEKDLYYYKKTSRDLKKKMRELVARSGSHGDGDDVGSSIASSLSVREGAVSYRMGRESGLREEVRNGGASLSVRFQEPEREGERGQGDTREDRKSTSRRDRRSHSDDKVPGSPSRKEAVPRIKTPSQTEDEDVFRDVPQNGGRDSSVIHKSRMLAEEQKDTVTSLQKSSYTSGDPSGSLREMTPVRKARRDLRQISPAEVSMRRSQATNVSQASLPVDSIEASAGSKNPWS
ncbi:kinesin-like protein KIF27 isoform X2 [Branchiostoma floridae]|uniref:Kinesin-like protein KIF27 isoform X2 n=1 Tax=Branchiostoma floridae TaxID=7739 RepID=A0A9J7KQ57_BRAFL|nr:kinesin-like protein KIF27 isoform X2 [Branchiostoma floridae]